MCAIFVLNAGELVEMSAVRYDAESDLQDYLEKHPELLSAEAATDERRQWLLVKREMGVADREDGSDRFSLDHLFVDQDAIPTFVEVKRSSNTDIRRKVVGQMLDYAANASKHWDAERLRASFESQERFADAEAANVELSGFLEGEFGVEEFWEAVANNLEERRLRLVFVADQIPPELRSIVEFLNEQLQLTEVNAVEIAQFQEPDEGHAYQAESGKTYLVPRVIGDTEMARRAKSPGRGGRRPRITEEQFLELMRAVHGPDLAERVIALYEHAKAHESRHSFGRGEPENVQVNVWLGESDDPDCDNPLALTFYGGGAIGVNMTLFRERRTAEEMARLVELLRPLRGASEVLDQAVAKDYRSLCTFSAAEVLATDDDLEKFKRVLDEAVQRSATG